MHSTLDDDKPEDSDDIEIPSDLNALDSYEDHSAVLGRELDAHLRPESETVRTLLFTATNPAGTISVTVLFGGQILRVDLSHQLSMTEVDLAAEITLITTLARCRPKRVSIS